MRNLLTSLIISFAVIATASTSYAGDDREDREWDRDKKEQHHHSKKENDSKKGRHRKGGLPACEAELAVCTGDLDSCDQAFDTCTTDLTTCDTDLGTCNTELSETTAELATCTSELATCEATAQAFPATGQVSCWDISANPNPIDCAGTGQDGDIQAGAELSYTDNGLTITDNNTKLEWMKQDDNDSLGTGVLIFCDTASYPGYLDKDCNFTWYEAFAFVANLNANNHAGGGWRVPNVKELQSIVNYENDFPAVSAEFDTGCVAGCTVDACSCTGADELLTADHWSSTTSPTYRSTAFTVDFGFGGLGSFRGKEDFSRVRAVRGGLID